MTRRLLSKELKLTASPLTYLFLVFPFGALVPSFPPLVGAVCVCLGIFYSFLNLKEDNDILFLFLLPNPRKDVVKAKYAFVLVVEAAAFLLSALLAALRMTVLGASTEYLASFTMPANLMFLGFALMIFGCFNSVFLGGFFRTMDGVGSHFAKFLAIALVLTGIVEGVHHVPGLEWIKVLNGIGLVVQCVVLAAGAALWFWLTSKSFRRSVQCFETYEFTLR